MSEMSSKTLNNKNSYLLRTQSTILKGEHIIPFNSLLTKYKNKRYYSSKNRNKTPKNRGRLLAQTPPSD